MSEYKITITATANLVGAEWSEEIDLVDDWDWDEDDAKNAYSQIVTESFLDTDYEEEFSRHAHEMAGFDWNITALPKEEVK